MAPMLMPAEKKLPTDMGWPGGEFERWGPSGDFRSIAFPSLFDPSVHVRPVSFLQFFRFVYHRISPILLPAKDQDQKCDPNWKKTITQSKNNKHNDLLSFLKVVQSANDREVVGFIKYVSKMTYRCNIFSPRGETPESQSYSRAIGLEDPGGAAMGPGRSLCGEGTAGGREGLRGNGPRSWAG